MENILENGAPSPEKRVIPGTFISGGLEYRVGELDEDLRGPAMVLASAQRWRQLAVEGTL